MNFTNTILHGDSVEQLKKVPDGVINMCVTSPPYYGLRNYGEKGQRGLEDTPEQFIENLVHVFREVKRVLKDDGTLWVNIGDSYCAGSRNSQQKQSFANNDHDLPANRRNKAQGDIKDKDLIGIPWMLAFALRADGWYLRQDIIWHKPNPMPESVKDRCTKSHEYIFLLSKAQRYYYDAEAISEELKYPDETRRPLGSKGAWEIDGRGQGENGGGNPYGSYPKKRNKRSVWTITTKPYKGAHFATFPLDLIEPCILAGCPKDGIVLDPFMGSGTTAVCALQNRRNYLGVELNKKYIKLADRRIINEGVYQENVFEEVLNG